MLWIFLLESISCVLFTNFTSLYYYQHIVFPYCSLKVHLPDLLDVMETVLGPSVNTRTSVPLAAKPVAGMMTVGAIIINQQVGEWAFDGLSSK